MNEEELISRSADASPSLVSKPSIEVLPVNTVASGSKGRSTKTLFFVILFFVILFLLVLLAVSSGFFSFSSKNTESPSKISTGSAVKKESEAGNSVSKELQLRRPRQVKKPTPPVFKSIDLKNP
ncbi:hypothetical protein HY947_01110 [Candidatus Gottesmanbacteria bacterium]|nr:hypothetical protein [Candidatus Gottesmanbacteria bacterium]